MTNNNSAFVHWRQTSLGSNTCMEYRNKADIIGYCAGITAVWINKSLASEGRGIKTADELGSQHLMGIIHSAFSRKMPRPQDYDIIDSITPLINFQNLVCWDFYRGKYHLNPGIIASWASFKPSHCIIAFNNEISGAGHIMGMRSEGNVLEMFEPDLGLFQYTDLKSLISHLHEVIFGFYSKCLGDNWGVLRVKSIFD
ncbi:hypothetical protein NX722_25075 [Endozoicomonas gorgoniicola]|uniref:Peptidase C58 YopT-type domain-containing protein n=1 Tax=Endozoicomonas gorgoniicola TaxID=1234144 RepID=A0ABT3N2H9_9GAMM|nr:hypothetical protein [Endozoicomonas gorgoniicola]MCW7555840.1 hypothetical protein [Endozoicomonas gorgoniicola]